MSTASGEHLKLDIDTGESSDRWLYQTTGHVRLLNKIQTPLYKLLDPESFNELLGAR